MCQLHHVQPGTNVSYKILQHQPQTQSRAKAAAAPGAAATAPGEAAATVEEKAAGHGDRRTQRKHAAKQKKGAGNDTVSEKLERVTEGRVCADTGVMLYHCRWAGFTPDDDTWEPREHIQGNPESLKFQRNDKDEDEFHESFNKGWRSTVGEQAKTTKKAPKRAKSGQPRTSKKCTKTGNGRQRHIDHRRAKPGNLSFRCELFARSR